MRGAEVRDQEPGSTVFNEAKKVERDLAAGEHVSRSGVYTPDTIDQLEEPRFIRAYETSVAAMVAVVDSDDHGVVAVVDSDDDNDRDDDSEGEEDDEEDEEQQMPTRDQIAAAQKIDPECQAWAKEDTFEELEGVLYRATNRTVHNAMALRYQLVIPKALRAVVCKALHGIYGTNHRGVLATVQVASARVYWPTMHTDFWKLAKRCPTCQRSGTAPNRAPYGEHLRSNIPQ